MGNYIPLTPEQIRASAEIEQQREAACQTLTCPSCSALPGFPCRDSYASAHLGRYRAAARLGLVPWLVGDRG